MSETIRMSGEQLRNISREFRREADQFAGSITRMDQLMNELVPQWEGAASKAYAQRFEALKPSFRNTTDLINELCKNLETIAKDFEEIDLKIATQFNSQQ